MKLYKHQQDFIDKREAKSLLCWGTGTGKTLTALTWAKESQTVDGDILIVAPKTLLTNWKRNALNIFDNYNVFEEDKQGNKIILRGITNDIIIISKERFKKEYDTDLLDHVDKVVIDECFVAGTKVLTPNGYKKIEDFNIGDKVISAYGEDEVVEVSSKEADITYKINNKIKCTGNHPFFTQRGWVKAKELNRSDVLLHYSTVSDIIKTNENKLFKLWKNKSKRFKELDKKILHQALSDELSLEIQERNNGNFSKKISQNKTLEGREFIKKNEEKQSNERYKDEGKSIKNTKINRTQTNGTRRKWERNASTTKNVISGTWERLVCRTCSANKNKKRKWLSNLLQNRYCKSKKNDCYRNRWGFSPIIKKTKARFKKDKISYGERVESIKIQKQRGTRVYNIGVKKHPSYVVEGVLVHNCHFFSSIKSQMFKKMNTFLKERDPDTLLLTATPYLSSPFNILALGTLLGKTSYEWSWIYFKKNYFYDVKLQPKNPYSRVISKVKNGLEKEMAKRVSEIGDIVKMEDCVDVPEDVYTTEYFKSTKEQEEAIDNILEPHFIAYWTKKHQIYGGGLKGDEYTEPEFFESEKFDRLKELLEENKKTIVVCRYNHEIEMISEYLKDKGKGHSIINGKVKDKQSVLDQAEKEEEHILLVNAFVAEGWEAKTFDTMIFYSYDFSLKNYIQMKGRIQRIDSLKKCNYISLVVENSIDEDVYTTVVVKKMDFHLEIYSDII